MTGILAGTLKTAFFNDYVGSSRLIVTSNLMESPRTKLYEVGGDGRSVNFYQPYVRALG